MAVAYERGQAPTKTRRKQRSAPRPARSAPRPAPTPAPARYYQSQGRDVAARSRPTTTNRQLRQAKVQARGYQSQGRAVRRQAKIQKAVGPGHAVTLKRHDPVLHAADIERYQRKPSTQARFREAAYKSQGASVEKRAKQQQKAAKYVKGKHGVKIPKEYLETDKLKMEQAGFVPEGIADKIISAPTKLVGKIAKDPGKFASNAAKDVGELAATTPSSLAHVAGIEGKAVLETAKRFGGKPLPTVPLPLIKANAKIAKETGEQYVELAKDPAGKAFKRPVTTALMLAPGFKLPKLAAGRAARTGVKVGGKTVVKPTQTLERPDAVLPGTTLRAKRTASRDVNKNRRQAREDRKNPNPKIVIPDRLSPADVPPGGRTSPKRVVAKTKDLGGRRRVTEGERQVDEHVDWEQQHQASRQESTAKQINEMVVGRKGPTTKRELPRWILDTRRAARRERRNPDPELAKAIENKVTGSQGGGRQFGERKFARRFGSHWYHDEKGRLRKPGDTAEGGGKIHATREQAQRVLDDLVANKHIDWKPEIMKVAGPTEGSTGGYAVVPEVLLQRYRHHGRVGKSPDTGAVLLREGSRAFRKTVLPYSVKWLAGQAVEGPLVRAAAAGAGPTSWVRYRRVMKELEKVDPTAAKELRERAVSGGYSGSTGPLADMMGKQPTYAEKFKTTGLASYGALATELGALPVVRHARAINNTATTVVFRDINGFIERNTKKAMLGKAIKQGPLMERGLLDITGKAAKEAAQGLRSTSNQIEAARQVDRMYGKYSKFGPHARGMIMHSTPFFPWFRNMVEFLVKVMPADHPVKTSLVASYAEADREWRESKRLSLYGKSPVPPWLRGSASTGKNKYAPAGRFMPALPGEPVKEIGGQAIPQFMGSLMASQGLDWKGNKIKNRKGEDVGDIGLAENIGLTALETFVPGSGQIDRVTGLGDYYVRGMTKKPSVVQGKSIKKGALDLINPVKPFELQDRGGGKRKKKRKAAPGFGFGGGSSTSGFGGGGGGKGFGG